MFGRIRPGRRSLIIVRIDCASCADLDVISLSLQYRGWHRLLLPMMGAVWTTTTTTSFFSIARMRRGRGLAVLCLFSILIRVRHWCYYIWWWRRRWWCEMDGWVEWLGELQKIFHRQNVRVWARSREAHGCQRSRHQQHVIRALRCLFVGWRVRMWFAAYGMNNFV